MKQRTDSIVLKKMDILQKYSSALWNVYHKTLRKKQRSKLTKQNEKKLAKVLFETKRLCVLIDAQRDAWNCGNCEKRWPIDPCIPQDDPDNMVFTLEEYPHMAPEIKKFMDRAAIEYVTIFGDV
jgi:hypothetical protein